MHLYVHVPFCARRCSYCDFAIAVRRTVPAREFVDAIAREMAARELRGDSLETLYFGGGTPSKLGGDGVAHLIDVVRARYDVATNAEVTIEANPEDVSLDAVRAWRAAGVTRVSLGAQSFDPAVLKWMHRTHDAGDISRAVHEVRAGGIANVSLDLIFALPESLNRDWSRDLDAALSLAPNHMSVYGLTIEPATPLGRWTARGESRETPEERWATEFMAAHDILGAAGFKHYEVSNYARDGFHSRHNSAYWQDRPYVGIGPSAHGFDGANRRWNTAAYAEWMTRVNAGEDPIGGEEHLTTEQRAAEQIYVGLRTNAGVDLSTVERDRLPVVQQWVDAGWASTHGHGSGILRLTPSGWMRLDAIAAALTPIRSRY